MKIDAVVEMLYKSYIGNGDSKTYCGILKAEPYVDIEVAKKECIGYVQKRMGSRLHKCINKTIQTIDKDNKTYKKSNWWKLFKIAAYIAGRIFSEGTTSILYYINVMAHAYVEKENATAYNPFLPFLSLVIKYILSKEKNVFSPLHISKLLSNKHSIALPDGQCLQAPTIGNKKKTFLIYSHHESRTNEWNTSTTISRRSREQKKIKIFFVRPCDLNEIADERRTTTKQNKNGKASTQNALKNLERMYAYTAGGYSDENRSIGNIYARVYQRKY